MKISEIVIARPKNAKQVKALEEFMKANKTSYEVADKESYNPQFVQKVLESRKEAKDGKVIRIEKENLKEFLGL